MVEDRQSMLLTKYVIIYNMYMYLNIMAPFFYIYHILPHTHNNKGLHATWLQQSIYGMFSYILLLYMHVAVTLLLKQTMSNNRDKSTFLQNKYLFEKGFRKEKKIGNIFGIATIFSVSSSLTPESLFSLQISPCNNVQMIYIFFYSSFVHPTIKVIYDYYYCPLTKVYLLKLIKKVFLLVEKKRKQINELVNPHKGIIDQTSMHQF
ncbi:hypothetical protein ACJX0J_009689, partial [Zea mays]